MGQQVQTASVAAQQVEQTINSLANQNDDMLWLEMAANGWFLLVFKPQAANWLPPQSPVTSPYGSINPNASTLK